jgi:hypothetical protein
MAHHTDTTTLGYVVLSNDNQWTHEAKCAGLDVELFVNDSGSQMDRMARFCRGEFQVPTLTKGHHTQKVEGQMCPVINECLFFALSNKERGVWGGTTEEERKRIKRDFDRGHLTESQLRGYYPGAAIAEARNSHLASSTNGNGSVLRKELRYTTTNSNGVASDTSGIEVVGAIRTGPDDADGLASEQEGLQDDVALFHGKRLA